MASDEVKAFTEEIDRLLNEMRPDRYTVTERMIQSGDGEDEESPSSEASPDQCDAGWMDDVVEAVIPLTPEDEVRKLYAEKMVRSREGHKTQNGNRIIRKLSDSGQYVLGWFEYMRTPVAIVTREPLWGGNVRIRDERVALERLTQDDLFAFETHERRRAAMDARTRNETCDAAQRIREQLIAVGAYTVGDYFKDAGHAKESAL